jgi:hypothetical protein
MRNSTSVALWVVRVTGVIQLALGVLFWTGSATYLVPVHMLVGTIFVLALWFLGFQAIVTGAAASLGIVSILWGLLTVGLGMTQATILPGPLHWVIQVVHLLVGMAAMGLADRTARSRATERMYAR